MGTRVLLAACITVRLFCESLPRIGGQTLSGKPLVLPEAVKGHAALLILGFTRGSKEQTKSWGQRVQHEFGTNTRLLVYSVAVLEDVPRFIRGMVVHGIKSDTPPERHDWFLVLYSGEKELKRVTGFQQPDDAYILLLAPNGEIRGNIHGPVSDGGIMQIRNALGALNTPPGP
jgi:hypothetical protein